MEAHRLERQSEAGERRVDFRRADAIAARQEATMANLDQTAVHKPVSTWRKVVAAILDFIFVFALAGYAIGHFTGNTTENGFELNGAPALLLFAIVIFYFIVFRRFLGGTVFQRLLGAR
jgi:hypothetical protein